MLFWSVEVSFPIVVIKHPVKSNGKKKGFILVHSMMVGKSQFEVIDHIVSAVMRQREMNVAFRSCSPVFFSPGLNPKECWALLSTIKMSLSFLINLTKIILHRDLSRN